MDSINSYKIFDGFYINFLLIKSLTRQMSNTDGNSLILKYLRNVASLASYLFECYY